MILSPAARGHGGSLRADHRTAVGVPRDAIGAAVFLAGDWAGLVTGHAVPFDVGYLTA